MRGPPWEGLLKNREPRLKPPYPTSCFGEKIGTLDSGKDCWELTGDLRDQYYTAIHPKLCERLFAIFGTASISDWITLPVYMIGEHCTSALPTVMICSEDENARKKAKKEIKKSGFLKRHARFKVMSVPGDPGMRNMEQLASDTNEGKATPAAKRAAKVLIDSSKPIQPLGMEVWVDHGLSLRPTTAFVSQIDGRTFLRTVDHAFVMTASPAGTTTTTRNVAIHVDSDSDSDSESEDEDELDVAITSIESQSPDTWSDTGSESGSSPAPTVFSERYTPRIGDFEYINSKAVSSDLEEVSSRLVPLVSLPTTYPPKQIVQPLKNTLVSLGRLAIWSVDKDWALIEITNEELMLAFERSIAEDAPPAKPLPGPKDDAEVVAYTSSGGMLTGTFSGTPFCTRLPNSTSFQDVHRVRLNGALANGDCGSAVRNAATGELYGHIVAGCRTTGTAYIMAAHQIEADFAALITEGLSGPNHALNDVQALTAQTAGTKEGNPQAVADRCQPTYTESRLQKFVGDLNTSGLGLREILAIITLAGSVLAALDKVIDVGNRFHNASNNLRRLRDIVSRLERQLGILQECHRKKLHIRSIGPSDLKYIKGTLKDCQQYAEGYNATLGLSRVFANFNSEKKIDQFRKDILTIYITVILPLCPQVLLDR